MVMGNFAFQTPGLASVGGAIILVAWLAVAATLIKGQRLQQPGNIVFVPNPFPLGIFATILGGSLVTLGSGVLDNITTPCLIVPLVVGFFLGAMQISALTVTVANEQGLASYLLFASRTVRWADIDWVYGVQSTMMGRNRRTVSLNQRAVMDSRYIVEAGRGQRITIPLQSGGDQRIANELLKTITARTAHAFRGERELANVRAARAAQSR